MISKACAKTPLKMIGREGERQRSSTVVGQALRAYSKIVRSLEGLNPVACLGWPRFRIRRSAVRKL